jgi:ABC-type Mn2+/Zn2+ transport system permease subunit
MLDIRLIIALLMGIYGLVLTTLGLAFTPDSDIAKSAGININLWSGLAMLLLALLFTTWAKLRPLTPPPPSSNQTHEPS